jgi:hypothetical protein
LIGSARSKKIFPTLIFENKAWNVQLLVFN